MGLGVVEYFGKRVLARKSWGIRGKSQEPHVEMRGFVSNSNVASLAHLTRLSQAPYGALGYVIDECSSSYLRVRRHRAALEPMG